MEEAAGRMEIVLKYFTEFSPQQIGQFEALEKLYNEWNARINIISRKDIDSLYEKHVLHSLAIAAVLSFTPDKDVIDIGTGGGFPGIPLAIFFPDTRFHLVDSIAKKLKVVDAVVDSLSLKNVTTSHIRAEEIKNLKFDTAVSRAVAPLKDLWRWARPLLRPQTVSPLQEDSIPAASGLICLKGGDLASEISESNTRPLVYEINDIFPMEYFKEKYVIQVPYQRKS